MLSLHEIQSFTPHQVARMLGVGVNTVRREIRLGNLDGYRIGSREWRISGRALAEYVARKEESEKQSRPWQ